MTGAPPLPLVLSPFSFLCQNHIFFLFALFPFPLFRCHISYSIFCAAASHLFIHLSLSLHSPFSLRFIVPQPLHLLLSPPLLRHNLSPPLLRYNLSNSSLRPFPCFRRSIIVVLLRLFAARTLPSEPVGSKVIMLLLFRLR